MSDFSIDLDGTNEELIQDENGDLHFQKRLPIDPTIDLQKIYDAKKRQVQVNEERISRFMNENKGHKAVMNSIEVKAIEREITLVL